MLLSALLLSLAISGRCHAHRKTRGKKKVIGQTIFFSLFFHFFVRKTTKPFFFSSNFGTTAAFTAKRKMEKKYIG
uniref:Putative secreted protein n=1 Tax=Ixodes ricinus TaxID=34613 RepID=A0A6B0TTB4_IXORI